MAVRRGAAQPNVPASAHIGPEYTSEAAERLSPVAVRAFANIARLWNLSPAEQRTLLGSIPESTFYKYLKSPESARLSRDTLARVSHLLGIFKALNILLPRKESADAWVHHANTASLFKGRSALAYMLSGEFEHIVDVRQYLDAQRGW